MKQTSRVALAKWAARGKQYLVMIRPMGTGLVMQQLLYADEVRPISEVPIPDAEIKEPELKLATQLIEQIASDQFHPEHYEDEVRKRYHEAIQRKVEGQEITAAPEAPRAQIIDLMEALKASLAKKSAPPTAAAPAVDEGEAATGTEGRPGPRAVPAPEGRRSSARGKSKS
jgi:DNA end-binding protein Ku